MILTRVKVPAPSFNNLNREELNIGSPHQSHRTVWRLMGRPELKKRPFLYRSDSDTRTIYILSSIQPTGTFAEELSATGWKIDSRPFEPALQVHMNLSFSLRISPQISKKNDKSEKRSRRYDLVQDVRKTIQADDGDFFPPSQADIEYTAANKWLEKRTEKSGFVIHPNTLKVGNYQRHGNPESVKDPNTQEEKFFPTLDLSGVLSVVNPELFAKTLYEGLGHAKAFGCGLMLIKAYSA